MGRAGLVSRPAVGFVDLDQVPGLGQVGGQHGERLVLAVLAGAQGGGGRLAGGVDGQVVAAQALDREDLAGGEQFARRA